MTGKNEQASFGTNHHVFVVKVFNQNAEGWAIVVIGFSAVETAFEAIGPFVQRRQCKYLYTIRTKAMLTIQVTNRQLEQQLIRQAQAVGKTAQQLAESLLEEGLNKSTPLSFSRLDPAKHSCPLEFNVDLQTDDKPVCQHVEDTTEFAEQLRQNAGKR
jgi:hypothetical protein